MKYKISILKASTVEEIQNYWTEEDYIKLLEKFNFPDAAKASKDTLRELLFMAITDYAPNEAAALLLEYKLSDQLSANQIQQVSNDMLLDKISEEYPDISLHATLFHVNQLLFKAFNGKFPNTKGTLLECRIEAMDETANEEFTKEKIIKLLGQGLSERSLIKRLFSGNLHDHTPFPDAENILWETITKDNKTFMIFTSEYWLHKEDLATEPFEAYYKEIVADVAK